MNNASPDRKSPALPFAFCVRALGVVLLLCYSLASSFAASSFTGIGALPDCTRSMARAVSKDGLVVVGESESQAFRWTEARGMVGLGYHPCGDSSAAYAVSSDGSVVVGGGRSVSGYQAFRWTASGGMVGLGQPRLSESKDTFRVDRAAATNSSRFAQSCNTDAHAVSSDGSVIVGSCIYSTCHEAFRWTASGGMVGLARLIHEQRKSRAKCRCAVLFMNNPG